MALDHYVSQVHLRKFYNVDKMRLLTFDKNTGKSALRSAKQVCRVDEGSTNEYLSEPRHIEEFLKPIENGYNEAIVSLQDGCISHDNIYNVAGYAAYIISCTPAAIRMQSAIALGLIRNAARLLDTQGVLPSSPTALGEKKASDLIESGEVNIIVDEKYPQAVVITDIERRLVALGNFHWQVLINDHLDTPFFTSDYPVAIERHAGKPLNRVFPLTPTLAVRIVPNNFRPPIYARHYDFGRFSMSRHRVARHEVVAINRGIVRCAERLVFSNHERTWLADFIKKNSDYRVDIKVSENVNGLGIMLQTDQAIGPFSRSDVNVYPRSVSSKSVVNTEQK